MQTSMMKLEVSEIDEVAAGLSGVSCALSVTGMVVTLGMGLPTGGLAWLAFGLAAASVADSCRK